MSAQKMYRIIPKKTGALGSILTIYCVVHFIDYFNFDTLTTHDFI